MVVTTATVIWVLARALTYTPSFWVCLYSLWLVVVYATQVAVINGLKPFPWISTQFFRALIVPDFAPSWQLVALWVLMFCVAPLAHLISLLNGI